MNSETFEFTHRRGLTIATSILAFFWGVFCLMILSYMLWPANLNDAVAAIAIGALLSCLLVVALSWALVRLFTKIRVDGSGLEQIRFGRITRVNFDAIEHIEIGRRWGDAWIDIRTPDCCVRITSDLTDYGQLFALLFDRFHQLRRHEEVSLPYTVWSPSFYFPLLVTVGLCSIAVGAILLCLSAAPLWPFQGILSILVGLLAFVAVVSVPSRFMFAPESISVANRLRKRVYPRSRLRGIHFSRILTLDFGERRLCISQSMVRIPLFLLYRILRRAYETAPLNNESILPSRASGDIG